MSDTEPKHGVDNVRQEFAKPLGDDYTDGRPPGVWRSKYEADARKEINREARFLALICVAVLVSCSVSLACANHTWRTTLLGVPFAVDFRLLAIFFLGSLGGVTFSIKWLIHSVAKCKWHLDRRYWRLFVPLLGGVYACVVLALMDAGLVGGHPASPPLPTSAALAFLVGYFSDGVSGLLSNIAGAVFGTLEKK
ncbi:MAG: hypothetical protein JNJ73_10705 [Hyphomonadaceae bacterium]|nr:hypothetical protein [Hyphomonadaceae bacterium]